MSAATPLDYAGRCERYARQRGWAYDPARLSIGHLTPRQRKRAIKKERSAWPLYSRRSIDMPWDDRYGAYNQDEYADDDTDDGRECGLDGYRCDSCSDDDERYAELQYEHNAAADLDEDWPSIPDAVAELERRFLGDLGNWKPTGLLPPPPTAIEQETRTP